MGSLLQPLGHAPVVAQHRLVMLPAGRRSQSLEGEYPRSAPLLNIRKCREDAAI